VIDYGLEECRSVRYVDKRVAVKFKAVCLVEACWISYAAMSDSVNRQPKVAAARWLTTFASPRAFNVQVLNEGVAGTGESGICRFGEGDDFIVDRGDRYSAHKARRLCSEL